jgi:hypothetical protein
MYCKKIRDSRGEWSPVEVYVRDRTEAEFSHGLCPECGPPSPDEPTSSSNEMGFICTEPNTATVGSRSPRISGASWPWRGPAVLEGIHRRSQSWGREERENPSSEPQLQSVRRALREDHQVQYECLNQFVISRSRPTRFSWSIVCQKAGNANAVSRVRMS